jgi:hypothetical protein
MTGQLQVGHQCVDDELAESTRIGCFILWAHKKNAGLYFVDDEVSCATAGRDDWC